MLSDVVLREDSGRDLSVTDSSIKLVSGLRNADYRRGGRFFLSSGTAGPVAWTDQSAPARPARRGEGRCQSRPTLPSGCSFWIVGEDPLG